MEMEMEMAAKVKTELAFSGLFRVVSILNKNFRDVITTEKMKPLNDFVDYKIEELIREAKSDDLVQLMPSLKELQAAALKMKGQLDLYEYEQIEKQVNSSSSEPIPTEKVLPKDLRDGLNKLLMIVELVQIIRNSATSKKGTTECDIFVDFLVAESHVPRPVIKLAISDISRVIKMLGSKYEGRIINHKILEQLKDVVSYHIQALIKNVNFDYLAQSVQLLDVLQAASLQLDRFNPYEFARIQKQNISFYSIPLEKFKPKLREELGPILFKSPLRIGLEKLLKFIGQVKIMRPSITSGIGTTQPQVNTITPTLRIGVEKWLKFVEQVEKRHPFITSKKGTTRLQNYTSTPISTTFFPGRGFLATISLENGKCQEDAEEIMQNYKNRLKELIFGWTNIASSPDTCKEILQRLEPDQNLENLSIISYSCSKFPNWMEKENLLPRLQTLVLRSCKSLKIVPFLPPRLKRLYVEKCHELRQLPPLSNTLCILVLWDCPNLTPPIMFSQPPGLWDLSFLTNLERLFLIQLPNLQALTNLSTTVTYLTINDCPKLTSLGNLQRCTSLVSLLILRCSMLKREEPSLVEGVVEGDIVNRLPQVDYIRTDEPLLVLELVQQQAFSSIKRLSLRDCAALPNLEKLSLLGTLHIADCPDVESLPNLPASLQHLRIERCSKLKEKYEEGGPLRNTISHIREVSIH